MIIKDKDDRKVEVEIDDEMRAVSGYYLEDGTSLTKKELKEIDWFCEDQIYPKWLARQGPGQKKSGQVPGIK